MRRWTAIGWMALLLAGVGASLATGSSAAAGENVKPWAMIQLDGSGSNDPDGDLLHYAWRQVGGPQVELSNPNAVKPTFRASKAGTYRFELTVSDGKTQSRPAVVEVMVERANTKPVAVLPAELKGQPEQLVTISSGRSYDEDGDPLTHQWTQITGPRLTLEEDDRRQPNLAFTPTEEGIYEFQLVVHDGRDESDPAKVRVLVKKPNVAPVAMATAPGKVMIRVRRKNGVPSAQTSGNVVVPLGEPVTLQGRGLDPDGDPLEFIWRQTAGPLVLEEAATAKNLTIQPRKDGLYIFELTVTDGISESRPATATVTVTLDDLRSMEQPARGPAEGGAPRTDVVVPTEEESIPSPELAPQGATRRTREESKPRSSFFQRFGQ